MGESTCGVRNVRRIGTVSRDVNRNIESLSSLLPDVSEVVISQVLEQSPDLNRAISALLAIAFALIASLIGGTRLIFSIPSFGAVGVAAVLCFFLGRSEPAPHVRCLGVTAVAFCYLLFRAHFSPVSFLSSADQFLLLGCLTVYAITAFRLHEARSRTWIIAVLLALAVFELFIALHQFTKGDNWMPFGFMRPDSGRRASGTFISSIHLAGFLEVVGVFALSFSFWSQWKMWARLLSGYVGVLCFFGVAITGSRGGYISSVLALASFTALSLYVIHGARPKSFRRIAILAAILWIAGMGGGVSLMNMDETLRTRLSLIPTQLEQNKLDVRIYNWRAALDQFRTSPIIGTGAGTHLFFGRYFRRPQIQTDPVHAHSDYLELLAEYGAIGALLIGAVLAIHIHFGLSTLGKVVKSEFRNLDPVEPARHDSVAMLIGALSAVAAYLAHSAVDFNMHIPANALIMAFVFGALANPGNAQASRPGWNWRGGIWIPPILGVCLLFTAVPKFQGELWAERARIALRNGDYRDALTFAQHALVHGAENPDLYFNVGEANRSIGMAVRPRSAKPPYFRNAVEAYRKGLNLFPQDENLWVRMGQALDELREFNEAESAYQTAIALDPNLAVLHRYYGAHLEARGRSDEALSQFEIEAELASGRRDESRTRPEPMLTPDKNTAPQ